MRTITTLIGTGILALLASCSSSSSISDPNASHTAFKSQKDYKASYTVYKDEKILADSSAKATKLVIDRTNQRALLYVGNKVAIDSPTTTGKAGKVTPAGSFKVTEKIKTKRSTIFGTLYKNGRRVYGGDRRKYHGSYDKYVGSPLPYWMRLTGDGIGLHGSGSIRRYPASNGCIRLPHSIAPIFFSKTAKYTPVIVK